MIALLRPLTVSAAALLLASSSAFDELAYHAEEGTVVERTFDFELEMDLVSLEMTVDGNEVPPEHFEGMEMNMSETHRIVVTDEYGERGDECPAVLKRTFDELSGESYEAATDPTGEESETTKDKTSDLEGATVIFTWDEEEEEYTVEFEDGGDEDLLEALVEDMDLRGFLPEDGDVDEGDSWEADIAAFQNLLEAGGELGLETDDEERTELDEELSDNLEGDVRVTYAGSREEDGVLVAVLELEISASTEGQGLEEGPMGEVTQTVEMEYELEGELLWAIDGGHLHSLELSGDLDAVITNESSFDGGAGPMEAVQTITLEGAIAFEVSVSAA